MLPLENLHVVRSGAVGTRDVRCGPVQRRVGGRCAVIRSRGHAAVQELSDALDIVVRNRLKHCVHEDIRHRRAVLDELERQAAGVSGA